MSHTFPPRPVDLTDIAPSSSAFVCGTSFPAVSSPFMLSVAGFQLNSLSGRVPRCRVPIFHCWTFTFHLHTSTIVWSCFLPLSFPWNSSGIEHPRGSLWGQLDSLLERDLFFCSDARRIISSLVKFGSNIILSLVYCSDSFFFFFFLEYGIPFQSGDDRMQCIFDAMYMGSLLERHQLSLFLNQLCPSQVLPSFDLALCPFPQPSPSLQQPFPVHQR